MPHEKLNVIHMRPTLCPHCGYLLDASARFKGGATPEPGDFTVCMDCASVLVFTADRGRRLPEPGEIEAKADVDELNKTVAAVREMHRQIGRPSAGRKTPTPS